MALAEVAESLGFRAELALAAGRPEVAHESLSTAIRLSGLIGSDGFLVSHLARARVIRRVQPTLARALRTAGWDKARISSLRNDFAMLDTLNGFRRALDVENISSFAMYEGARTHPEFIGWGNIQKLPEWQYGLLVRVARKLPLGWYQENAALGARLGLQLRKELGEDGDLHSWFQACERAKERAQFTSDWESWRYPMKNNGFGAAFKNACRNQSLVQLAMLACDLEIHRLDHGRYPGRLQESASPLITDSMSGEPFIYRLTDSGYLLYSVGFDLTDNGGDRSEQDFHHPRDWIW
jgi:hypothetical protein